MLFQIILLLQTITPETRIRSIVQDILPGVIKGADYQIELDRKKAIENSISSMNKKEILLILGKGHEDYQLVKGVKTYFSDKEVLLSAIQSNNEN